MRKYSGVSIVVGTMLALGMSAMAEGTGVITVRQTERLLGYRGHDAIPISVLSKANPKVRKQLLEIIVSRPEGAKMWDILRMLGYVGKESDVKVIVGLLDDTVRETGKKLTDEQEEAFVAGVDALGTMSHRGVPGAKDAAKTLVYNVPWVEFGKRWYSDRVIGRSPRAKYIAMDQFIQRYAVSQDPNLKKYQETLTAKAKGMTRTQLAMFDLDTLNRIGNTRRLEEKKAIPEEFRFFLADKEEQSKIRKKWDAERKAAVEAAKIRTFDDNGYLARTASDAIQAYERISGAVLSDESDSMKLRPLLLDDCKVIAARKWNDDVIRKKLIQGVKRQRPILRAMKSMRLDPYRNFSAQTEGKYRMSSLPMADLQERTEGATQVTGYEEVVVTFDIPKTAVLCKKHFPRIDRKSKTTDEKGNFRVYMKRINGKWMWNPFGW